MTARKSSQPTGVPGVDTDEQDGGNASASDSDEDDTSGDGSVEDADSDLVRFPACGAPSISFVFCV